MTEILLATPAPNTVLVQMTASHSQSVVTLEATGDVVGGPLFADTLLEAGTLLDAGGTV